MEQRTLAIGENIYSHRAKHPHRHTLAIGENTYSHRTKHLLTQNQTHTQTHIADRSMWKKKKNNKKNTHGIKIQRWLIMHTSWHTLTLTAILSTFSMWCLQNTHYKFTSKNRTIFSALRLALIWFQLQYVAEISDNVQPESVITVMVPLFHIMSLHRTL